MKLHELTEGALKIERIIAERGEEERELWKDALDDIFGDVEDKIINCGYVYRNFVADAELLEAEAEIYKKEYDRIMGKSNSTRKKAENLRMHVEDNMRDLNLDDVKASTFKAKFKKLPNMVDDDSIDLEKLADDYKRFIPADEKADKKAILEAFKNGKEVDGAKVVIGRTKLEFK